jgi:ADP-ribose pyrophosphatase YjhB (NUDIX family)
MPEALMPLLARLWRLLPERVQWRLLWLAVPKFSVGVTGIVFDDAGQVLLLRHTFRRRYPWGLVSGWVKRGEALEAALHREVAEETGLAVRIERLFCVRTDRLRSMLEVVYLCRFAGGEFRPSAEVTELRWCRADDLPPGVHPDHHPFLRDAQVRARVPAPNAAN